ncbi:MAG TPA: oligosaccharide flippase family protein [Phycisphaerales bacterium]|nr:oligosaccharide flippase family protein [Phycisphaerales bacterium]HRQ75542.1 oligosaccharide flippase family protein [Phycisphaerales bacterium]
MTQLSDMTPNPPPRGPTYGARATHGMAAAGMVVVVAKLSSVASQFMLGWLLSKNDFALYGLAISLGALVSILRDGGTSKVLLQRGPENYSHLARPVLQMSLGFNILAALLLVSCATSLADLFATEDIADIENRLPPLIWVIAASLPIMSPVARLRVRLSLSLRFGAIARVDVRSAILRHSSMILLALLGFGPMSFVLPSLIVAISEWIMFSRAAANEPKPERVNLSWPVFKDLFGASKWLMLTACMSAVVNFGDNLSIGKLQPAVLGDYVFAFGLSAALGALFGDSIRSVLMATFVHLKHDPDRHGRAFMQTVRLSSFALTPIFVGAALMAPLLIQIAWWDGRWMHISLIVQLLMLSLVMRTLTPLGLAGIESVGRWRLLAGLLALDGVGTVAVASLAAWYGGLVEIAIAVSINRAVMGLLQCMVAAGLSGVRNPVISVLVGVAPPYILGAAAGIAALMIANMLVGETIWLHSFVAAGLFAILFSAGALAGMKRRVRELTQRIQAVVKRRR